MNFQQGWLLWALPLAAIPILIHLINQRRFQTVRWGAMMFLLAANRLSRGYARIRQWLILACRTLAVLGLLLAVARPLASGWLGWAGGGRADTTLVLLDRSPSMQQTAPSGGLSKYETGRRQLVQALSRLGSNRWLVLDGTSPTPRELQQPDDLTGPAFSEPVAQATDIPALLEQARDYLVANQAGRTEIWLLSDLRGNDWDAEGGRWGALREVLGPLSGQVRLHLLAYGQPAPGNLSVRVTEVRRRKTAERAELLLSLQVTREGAVPGEGTQTVPLQLELDGARSELSVELVGNRLDLKEHRLPLENSQTRGWGRVSLPADINPGDNEAWFAYGESPPRQTLVVTEDAGATRPLELAAAISSDARAPAEAVVLTPAELPGVDWSPVGLVIWATPLPTGEALTQLEQHVAGGGQVLFLPSGDGGPARAFGVGYGGWETPAAPLKIETWRADADLLANALSGQSLPVGLIEVFRHATLVGEGTPLAELPGGAPWLLRVPTNRGGVAFLATTASTADSNLATNGVVLYVLVQRALAEGSALLGTARQLTAGVAEAGSSEWQRVAGGADVPAGGNTAHAGVYAGGERLYAVNRPVAEDLGTALPEERVDSLFDGLNYSRVSDQAGSLAGLVQEIWRMFLATMLLALVGEAALCLPQLRRTPASPAPNAWGGPATAVGSGAGGAAGGMVAAGGGSPSAPGTGAGGFPTSGWGGREGRA